MLGGCAAVGAGSGGAGETQIRSGKIEQITLTQMQTNHDSGVGAILGGLGGLALGSLVGQGTGRDVAMVAGALAGGVGGNYVEKKKYDQPVDAQQIIVRTQSGVLVQVTQPINPALTKGLNVYVEGSGNDARVVPQS
ncbi:hypothetical protein D9M73_179610 [compost metagenome]